MGKHKGMLSVGGEPILTYLLDRLGFAGPKMLVTAPGRGHPPGWDQFDREVSDPVARGGPLQGVLTALNESTTEENIILTVDMPEVTSDALAWLMERFCARRDALAMMNRRTAAGQEIVEPFPLCCRKAAAPVITRRLATGRRAMHLLLEEPGFIAEPVPEDWPATLWTNLNNPSDLHEFQRRRAQ
jgi:molybdopterin-guanine dinucleotide biosynthesis protein A